MAPCNLLGERFPAGKQSLESMYLALTEGNRNEMSNGGQIHESRAECDNKTGTHRLPRRWRQLRLASHMACRRCSSPAPAKTAKRSSFGACDIA